MLFSKVVLYVKISYFFVIVVDEIGQLSVKGEEIEEVFDYDEKMSFNGSFCFIESFEIEVNVLGDEDDFLFNIYCVIEDYEVDDEMSFFKGEYV